MAENAADCNTPVNNFSDQPLAFGADKSYTVTFEGSAAFTIKTTNIEDRGAPETGKVGYQAHNALTSTGPTDFGLLDEADPGGPAFYPIAQNLVPLVGDGKGEFDASKYRPSWIVSGAASPTLLAQSPAVDMAAGEIYAAFIHGTKADDTNPALQPAAIICRNYLTIADKTAAGEYATPGNVITKSCVYGPTGQ